MTFNKNVRFALAALAAGIALPVSAQVAAPQLAPGMQVYDTHNANIGAIAKLADGQAYVQTNKYVVPLATNSFAVDKGKVYLSLDQAGVNAFYENTVLPAEQSLQVGKPVKGTNGAVLGTIKEINDTKVILALPTGQLIELPRDGVAGGATGATAGISADDLAKQLGTTAAAPAAAAGATAGADAK